MQDQDLIISGFTVAHVATFNAFLNFEPTHVSWMNSGIQNTTGDAVEDTTTIWKATWLAENDNIIGYSLNNNTYNGDIAVFRSNPVSISQPIKNRVRPGLNGQSLTLTRRTPDNSAPAEQVDYVIHLRFHRE